MWFVLSIFATLTMVLRRTTEKKVVDGIDSLALAWLQQAAALPFIVMTVFFTKFYLPTELSSDFWIVMAMYVFLCSIDLYCYFKALSIADVSLVAPFMTLAAVGNIVGAYFILGQIPSLLGVMGALLIIIGAYVIHRSKESTEVSRISDKKALWFVLILVFARSAGSNIEVFMLRESNPTSFNLYSTIFTVIFVLAISYLMRPKRNPNHTNYWKEVKFSIYHNVKPLVFIGFTLMLALTATYQAKILAPNAGYVGAVKASAVVPMVIIGVMFFKEKFVNAQWLGLILVVVGLAALATN
ncbi:MAG: EamA family transporter [Candidatus Saccharibacteria bacterium]|nr:EamA family transporter [Candidatus Saccharibacteria bacterium]